MPKIFLSCYIFCDGCHSYSWYCYSFPHRPFYNYTQYTGISLEHRASTPQVGIRRLRIENNRFIRTIWGINCLYGKSRELFITENQFDDNGYGLLLQDADTVTISRNKINASGIISICISSGRKITIESNLITHKKSRASRSILLGNLGWSYNPRDVSIINNTINQQVDSGSTFSYAIHNHASRVTRL